MKTRQIVYGSDLDWLIVYEFTDRVYVPNFGEFDTVADLVSEYECKYNLHIHDMDDSFGSFMSRMIDLYKEEE